MIENKPKRILIAPLDWGMGHTTRCLPLIRHLQRMGHHVIVACNGWQKSFIEQTVINIEFTHIEGYNISYMANAGKAGNIQLLPRINKAIRNEHSWLQKQLPILKPDAIISDNRYGLHSNLLPCVIMTHQLQIQTGMGATANRIMQRLHYGLLEKFDEVWVPDVAGDTNLAGALSHPKHLPKHTRYIGLLSQFEGIRKTEWNNGHLLILLSGPEPQRTILADLLINQLQKYNGQVIFVAGSESAPLPHQSLPPHISFYKTLSGKQLADAITGAGIIISRSGYTTIMDMVLLGKKIIMIPTPGQTEQEYLANHLQQQGIFPSYLQKEFELTKALEDAQNFPYYLPQLQGNYSSYKDVIDKWLATLPNK